MGQRRRGRSFRVALLLASSGWLALLAPSPALGVGELTYEGCVANGGANGCVDPPQDSLNGAFGVAVSPDGNDVYVASALGDSITHLRRDPSTGALTYQGCVADAGANGCVNPPQDPLSFARGVAVSPDGTSVYVASFSDDSITHFLRNPSTGGLTYQGCIASLGAAGCIDPPQDSLDGATGVTVSPDGTSVYVGSFDGNSVTHLTRDTSSGPTHGFIAYQGCVANGGANGCIDPPQDSLDVAEGVAVSPDGASVYVASGGGDSVTHLTRDTSSGPTHGFIAYQGCVANVEANGCVDPPHDSLDAAQGVAISPDGASVYVASYSGQSVTHLTRATPPPQFCAGKRATVVGTAKADHIPGTPGNDVMVGLGGKDRISGRGGKDTICGGDKNDTLKGGGGKDKLLGQRGNDVLRGGPGKDILRGGPGKDIQVQ